MSFLFYLNIFDILMMKLILLKKGGEFYIEKQKWYKDNDYSIKKLAKESNCSKDAVKSAYVYFYGTEKDFISLWKTIKDDPDLSSEKLYQIFSNQELPAKIMEKQHLRSWEMIMCRVRQ